MFEGLKGYLIGIKEALFPIRGLRAMVHSIGRPFSFANLLPRADINYEGDIGQGTRSSSIMGPIQFIQRTFPEAPLCISNMMPGSEDIIREHKLLDLVCHPNGFYDCDQLWMATIYSWCIAGNAYWVKVRNSAGAVIQLWYVPHWMINPEQPVAGESTEFITSYKYSPIGDQTYYLPVRDVVHFRNGIDPEYPQLGLSPLSSVLREVWADDESSNWVASLLRNSGIPGVIISPDPTGSNMNVLPMDVQEVKEYVEANFSGKGRGKPLVLGGPTKVAEFGYDPKKMDLSVVRNTAEERVCACLGIPAAVIGFGTGLNSTKVGATMREFAKQAWVDGIIPLQRIFSNELNRSLASEFAINQSRYMVKFDHSKIPALQDDINALFERADKGVKGGWLTVAEAKRMVGMSAEPEDDVYLRAQNIVAIPEGTDALDIMAMTQQALQPPAQPQQALPAPEGDTTDAEEMADFVDYLTKASSALQSLIFPKTKWKSASDCADWLRKHDLKSNLDETKSSWRARQRDPGDFQLLRTICIAPSRHTAMRNCRIKAIVGPTKSLIEDVTVNTNGATHDENVH